MRNIQLISAPPAAVRHLIRQFQSHKGLYGSVAVIGGAPTMVGAALLAGRAALHLGSGKVYVGLLRPSLIVDQIQPELMLSKAKNLLKSQNLSHILIGPGLGQSSKSKDLLAKCLKLNTPLIIDADGLNLIAQDQSLHLLLKSRPANTILTPHPTEAARLLNISTIRIQENRIQSAVQLQEKYGCGIILKGHETLVCCKGSTIFQNQTGNSALSSAGQGDVLGGIILALWAQGLNMNDACCTGVYLHGQAADLWRAHNPNGIGLTASETISLSRIALNSCLKKLKQ